MAVSSREPCVPICSRREPNTFCTNDQPLRVGNLIKLLPTGTVFLYLFLSPVLSNNGYCNTINKNLTAILVGLCGLSCFFSTFTHSYVGDDSKRHYGIATCKGLWPSPESKTVDVPRYKLLFADFVHAFFAVIVSGALVPLDGNTLGCLLLSGVSVQREDFAPDAAACCCVVSGVVFFFSIKGHGIGYPASESSKDSNSGGEVSKHELSRCGTESPLHLCWRSVLVPTNRVRVSPRIRYWRQWFDFSFFVTNFYSATSLPFLVRRTSK
ncbi:protein DMP2-like [Corylus avellana]|uniref:protein DMP2-like n=1 Tax=Corylus avellana TaxID=13451 RepID=UPI00286B90D9|nr:protein DMP2-like [Corylus avellana]